MLLVDLSALANFELGEKFVVVIFVPILLGQVLGLVGEDVGPVVLEDGVEMLVTFFNVSRPLRELFYVAWVVLRRDYSSVQLVEDFILAILAGD